MRKIFILLSFYFLFNAINTQAQSVLINSEGGQADSSAMLDIRASSKGILIPRMTNIERLAISNPAQGLLVFQNNGLEAFYFYNGAAWDTLNLSRKVNIVTAKTNSDIAIISDIKSSGTNGGTFTSGSWQTRDLNVLEGDSSFISIDNISAFTLDSGIYQINANAPAKQVDGHQIRLYDTTNSQMISVGTVIRSATASPNSILNSVFQINSPTTFVIQHRCEDTNSSLDAMGVGVSWGSSIFTQVRIRKL